MQSGAFLLKKFHFDCWYNSLKDYLFHIKLLSSLSLLKCKMINYETGCLETLIYCLGAIPLSFERILQPDH